jgi:alanine-synthesizing transaminase
VTKPGIGFSKRTSWDIGESEFSRAVRLAREEGRALLDLTVSNPTACGLRYDAEAVLGPLRQEAALGYDPDPRGMWSAREAVGRYYADHGAAGDPDAVVLTTSTSEVYSYLFRLLCDPGDEVLVAQPSYPLFDFLADLDDVQLRPYPLFYDFGWWIDFAELERRIGPRTRAVLVVHPNNPTGHWTHRAERERLEAICARHGLALIVDEVFLDYPLAGEPAAASFAVGLHPALTFVLSGMSKIAALPQMKVAWLVVFGPEELRRGALGRLEVIADTFLSMGAPAQLALPEWLASREAIQAQIAARTAGNLAALRAHSAGIEALRGAMLRVEAGWAAVLLLRGWEAPSRRLLAECGVVVHPGDFYGLADARMVVVSLLTPLAVFQEAMERFSRVGEGNQGR